MKNIRQQIYKRMTSVIFFRFETFLARCLVLRNKNVGFRGFCRLPIDHHIVLRIKAFSENRFRREDKFIPLSI